MWHADDGMGWWMVFGSVVWLLLWGSILWVIVSAIRPGRRADRESDALEIARRRYASGAISHDEFVHIRDDLRLSIDDPGSSVRRDQPGDPPQLTTGGDTVPRT